MTSSASRVVSLVACLMCVFATIFLYQKKSTEILLRTAPTPSADISQSQDTDLIFLENAEIRRDMQTNREDLGRVFFKFVSIHHFVCQNSARLGNILDGGWDICLVEPYRPKRPCLVYSFGINNDFSFDDAISDKFSCTVRSFDPSMKVQDHQRNANVWFYKIGISGRDMVNGQGWIMKTLSTIIKSMNDTDVLIDYLKMDVEGSEWSSLSQMLSDGTLSKVKQLGIELHVGGTDIKSIFNMYKILKQLEDQGFRRWYYTPNLYHMKRTKNGFRSCCYEIVYINKKFLQE